MTERNFTVVIPGFYNTRNGRIAEVVQIMNPRLDYPFPVRGFLPKDDVYIISECWNLKGDCWTSIGSPDDLITFIGTELPRKKKKVKLTKWINVYRNHPSYAYETRELADTYADCNRIACVEMTGEYEVEVTE